MSSSVTILKKNLLPSLSAATAAAKGEKMNIREERRKKGLSQLRLAHEAGVSKYRVFLSEQGFIKLSQTELDKINIALKINKNDRGLYENN